MPDSFSNTFLIRRGLEFECLVELGAVEEVIRLALIEHFDAVSDIAVEQSRHLKHPPRENPVRRLEAKLFRNDFNELLAGEGTYPNLDISSSSEQSCSPPCAAQNIILSSGSGRSTDEVGLIKQKSSR
jgi:hypothetical protein